MTDAPDDHDLTDQTPQAHDDQPGEALDDDKLPSEMPQKPMASFAHGTTVAEQKAGPSLDRRTNSERPDVTVDPEEDSPEER